MLVRTAKRLAGGARITKVVTWDAIGQEADTENDRGETIHAPIRQSAMIYRPETKRYHEDGDLSEEGYILSDVLDTDAVLEMWTVEGQVFQATFRSVTGIVGKG